MHPDVSIYVISLPEQFHRRKILQDSICASLHLTFVDALWGRDILQTEEKAGVRRDLYSGRIGRMLTPSEIGCSLSHKKTLETFLSDGKPWGLILEDDVEISDRQCELLNWLIEKLDGREEFELIKLGGWGEWTSYGCYTDKKGDVTVLGIVTFGVCSHGYLVSRRGALKIACSIEPVSEPFDTFLRSSHRHRCEIFEVSPWLVSLNEQYMLVSSIESERVEAMTEIARGKSMYMRVRDFIDLKVYNFARWLCGLQRFGLGFLLTKKSLIRLPTEMRL